MQAEDFYTGYLGVAYVKVFRGLADGGYEPYPRFISRGFDASHVGNGTICVTHKNGRDYLLLSTIYEMQGEAAYDYAVIYIDDKEGIVMEDSAGAEFAVDSDQDLSSIIEECPANVFFDMVWEREW